MAPPASKKQKRASHGSQNPPKYPSTLDIPSAGTDQIETKEGTQAANSQAQFDVRREWQIWPSLESLTQKAANINTATFGSSNSHLTPMERWRMETQQQSSWDNVAAVTASDQRPPSDVGERPMDGSQGGDTDNGTWCP